MEAVGPRRAVPAAAERRPDGTHKRAISNCYTTRCRAPVLPRDRPAAERQHRSRRCGQRIAHAPVAGGDQVVARPREGRRGCSVAESYALEAALWCVGRTESVADALILAVNLGHDADTAGAVTGQLAGALWGMSGAPTAWLDRIESLAADLFHSTEVRNPGRWAAPPGGILQNAEGVIIDPPPGPLRDRLVACTRAWTTYRRRGDPRPLIALGLFPEGSPWVDPETLEPLDPQPNPDDLGPAPDPYTPLPGG